MAEARRVLAETETQLARYRAACDAGADPAVVAGWIAETKARRARAEQVLRGSHHRKRMTRDEIAALVAALGEIWATLQNADPADKAEVYRHLGLGLTYMPQDKLVEVKIEPAGIWGKNRVGEEIFTIPPWPALRCELVVA
jgi:site-specific DNA recombinase